MHADTLLSIISRNKVHSSILVLQDPWTAEKFRFAMARKVDSSALFYVAVPKPASATDNKTEFLQGKNYIFIQDFYLQPDVQWAKIIAVTCKSKSPPASGPHIQ
jgi:hypothetical protein